MTIGRYDSVSSADAFPLVESKEEEAREEERDILERRYIMPIRSIPRSSSSATIYLHHSLTIAAMSGYANPPSINPYWYYESQGYQPNTSIPFPSHDSGLFADFPKRGFSHRLSEFPVDSPTHSSFDMYTNRFVDSGYLSRTPTPPTPVRNPSPAPVPFRTRNEQDPQHGKLNSDDHFTSTFVGSCV